MNSSCGRPIDPNMQSSPRPLVKDSPKRSEPVSKLREPRREERFCDWHAYLTSDRQNRIDLFCSFCGVDGEIQIRTADRFEAIRRHVVSDQLHSRDVHARVNDSILGTWRRFDFRWKLTLFHHHRNLSAEVLLIEAERLFA